MFDFHLAVGADQYDSSYSEGGAVCVLFMKSDGTVKDYQKISNSSGGFSGVLDDFDYFGLSVSSVGDLDNDNDGIPNYQDRDDDNDSLSDDNDPYQYTPGYGYGTKKRKSNPWK